MLKIGKLFGLLVLLPIIAGCAGSPARNVSDPSRKDFTVEGFKISVVPQSDHWSAWYSSEKFIEAMPPLPLLKRAEIKAIEQYSGCKVVSAEIVGGSVLPAYLQAIVNCQPGPV